MPNNTIRKARKPPWQIVVTLVLCFALGIALALVSALEPCGESRAIYVVMWDLVHDLGIAFSVSAVVGGLFELYRITRHQLESMRDVLDEVMNDRITPELWMDVEALIEKKNVIRRNVFLRLEIQEGDGLQRHERILRVDHDYDLYPLHEKREEFTVRHELDYQFARPLLRLPRWETAVVRHVDPNEDAGKSRGTQPRDVLPKDKLERRIEFVLSLPSRKSDEYEQISVSRYELVTLPGSYNFYVPEFVKGIKISLVGRPDWIDAEVIARPYGGGDPLQNDQDSWYCDKLLFPGQGLEVKFKERAVSAPQEAAPGH